VADMKIEWGAAEASHRTGMQTKDTMSRSAMTCNPSVRVRLCPMYVMMSSWVRTAEYPKRLYRKSGDTGH